MKIAATREFKRSRAKVFAAFSDPERMETVLGGLGRNTGRDGPAQGGVGTVWNVEVTSRGKPVAVTLTLVELIPAEVMVLHAASEILEADIRLEFSDLADGGCQVAARIEVKARTLTARVAIQTARLAQARINQKIVRALTVLGKPADRPAG